MILSPNEEIPDNEILFRYCMPQAFPLGQSEIPTSIFNDPSLSCDWERYRLDPSTSFHIAEGRTRIISITINDEIRNPRNPKRKGQLVTEWRQQITHAPLTEEEDKRHGANEAHSLIEGRKKPAVCEALVKSSTWRDAADFY